MTEFKRCTAEVEDLCAVAERLDDRESWEQDVESAKRDADRCLAAVDDLRRRVAKLLTKARERDPDKQIYNERMCARIEELGARADEVFAKAEQSVGPVLVAHCSWLRERMRKDEYRLAMQNTAKAVSDRETDHRFALQYDERDAWITLCGLAAQDYDVARARQLAREEAEWNAELKRRHEELEHFEVVRTRAIREDFDSVKRCLSVAQPSLVTALGRLFDAVLADPSNTGVQRLRNAHPALLADFGHPFAEPAQDTAEARSAATMARARYETFETVVAAAGYQPTYSSSSLGPAAPGLSSWRVSAATPWCRYGERLLTLVEPSISEQPDEWMSWHERLQSLHKILRQYGK